MSFLKETVWRYRQKRNRPPELKRPVLDLVDFGTTAGHVLDVGANRGGFASEVLVRAPLMSVHCFEPNSDLAKRLTSKAEVWGLLNGAPRATVHRCAVGSEVTTQELIVTEFHAASSLLSVTDATRHGWPEADFNEARRETVDVIRLDGFLDNHEIDQVVLLKLDVQGFELEALKGCGEALARVQHVICEVQFQPLYESAPLWHEIVQHCQTFGLDPVVMDGFCFGAKGEPLQADLLLKRSP